MIDIALNRLDSQQLIVPHFDKPEEVVAFMGAVQAQDYAAAKWAVGQRTLGVMDEDIEQAFAQGKILRTHVMRPTWHFVSPADIRWMLALTGPRVNAGSAYRYRQLELDEDTFLRSNTVLIEALRGGKQLTRAELISTLEQAGISTAGQRFIHLMMRAELDGVVCSGARREKQHTYTLLDERAPQSRTLEREQALVELTRRYMTSHGPATVKDYVWWSGLTVTDAKAALKMLDSELQHEIVDGETYWFVQSSAPLTKSTKTVHLIAYYDEYTVGYTGRAAMIDQQRMGDIRLRAETLLSNVIIIGGKAAGTWKREFKKNSVVITILPFSPLSTDEEEGVNAAALRYGAFLGLDVLRA